MKKTHLILTNPCIQDWNEMQPSGAGRYCDSCEKHIVDLTMKSDAELIQFFKNKKDDTCGRLLSSQLHRELTVMPPKKNWYWLLPFAMGVMAIRPAQAKELRPVAAEKSQGYSSVRLNVDTAVKPHLSPVVIRGKVVDSHTGKPLARVKVRKEGFENVLAITDSSGVFELPADQDNMVSVFTFELIGYSGMSSTLNEGMVISLINYDSIRIGGISTLSVSNTPLYVVYSGKKSCFLDAARINEIQPAWIEKLEVWKGTKATALYGAKAAHGVVVINIHKAYENKVDFSDQR